MRIVVTLLFAILAFYMFTKFNKVAETRIRDSKTFEQQKQETLEKFEHTKDALEEYKKERAKGLNR